MVGQKLQYSLVGTRRIGIVNAVISKQPLSLLHRPGLDSCATSVLALRIQALASPRNRKPSGRLVVTYVPHTCYSAAVARQSLHRLILRPSDGRPCGLNAFIGESTWLKTVSLLLREPNVAVVNQYRGVAGEHIVRVLASAFGVRISAAV
jgi:hypothetical protein